MPKDYLTPPEMARKMEQKILQSLQESGLAKTISVCTGISESTISRLKTDHLSNFCQVLAHAGFKLVPSDEHTISAEKLNAFATLAAAAFGNSEAIVKTLMEDGE